MTYHPLVVLHDIIIVLDYSILGYSQHVCPFNSHWSSPSSLWHERRRQYQHLGAFFVPSQTDEQFGLPPHLRFKDSLKGKALPTCGRKMVPSDSVTSSLSSSYFWFALVVCLGLLF